MTSTELLPLLRDLYSRLPEMRALGPWEPQSALFVLGYTDELEGTCCVTPSLLPRLWNRV
jgi:hypothetical protein